VSHGLGGMAVGRLRITFGLEHKRYPSVLTGFKVETKAIRHRLDFINLDAHVAPPLKRPDKLKYRQH
jgi:hypothetical protein